jgi:cytoskeleton protein RodZ
VLKFGRLPKLPKFAFRLPSLPGGGSGLVAGIAGAVLLFAGASWLMMPEGDWPAPAGMAALSPSSDPMPTSSTGNEEAEVKITEEPLADDQVAIADLAEEEQAGTDLGGLGALIEEKLGAPKAKAGEVASAEDVSSGPEGRVFGASTGGSRLVIKAKAPVWVRIEDAQGQVVLTQMLLTGDTYQVPDRKGLVVIARDGGLLSYMIDGKEKGILGTPGEILVGRPLDIELLDRQG